MLKSSFDALFLVSVFAPIAALIVGAFALAVPTMRLRRRRGPTRPRVPAHV